MIGENPPFGGTLLADAGCEIVSELSHNSATGSLQLKATGLDEQGDTVDVNNHISEQGSVISDSLQTQQQASAMLNSLMAANQWDKMNDLGKLSALVNLYNATDTLSKNDDQIRSAA